MAGKTQQNERQREIILSAARRLFWEKSFMGTTMRDIANACGFEPGNLYNYFGSKESILYEVLKAGGEGNIASVEGLEGASSLAPSGRLRLFIRNATDHMLTDSTSTGVLSDFELKHVSKEHRRELIDRYRGRFDRILSDILQAGIDEGEFAPIDVRLATFSIGAMIFRTKLWSSPSGRLSPDEIAEFIYRFVVDGLRRDGVQAEPVAAGNVAEAHGSRTHPGQRLLPRRRF